MDLEELIQIAHEVDANLYGEVRTDDLLHYLLGEIEELRDASNSLEKEGYDNNVRLNQIEEFGDVLFCLMAFARQKDIDVQQALSLTLIKLKDRLKHKQNGKSY